MDTYKFVVNIMVKYLLRNQGSGKNFLEEYEMILVVRYWNEIQENKNMHVYFMIVLVSQAVRLRIDPPKTREDINSYIHCSNREAQKMRRRLFLRAAGACIKWVFKNFAYNCLEYTLFLLKRKELSFGRRYDQWLHEMAQKILVEGLSVLDWRDCGKFEDLSILHQIVVMDGFSQIVGSKRGSDMKLDLYIKSLEGIRRHSLRDCGFQFYPVMAS